MEVSGAHSQWMYVKTWSLEYRILNEGDSAQGCFVRSYGAALIAFFGRARTCVVIPGLSCT